MSCGYFLANAEVYPCDVFDVHLTFVACVILSGSKSKSVQYFLPKVLRNTAFHKGYNKRYYLLKMKCRTKPLKVSTHTLLRSVIMEVEERMIWIFLEASYITVRRGHLTKTREFNQANYIYLIFAKISDLTCVNFSDVYNNALRFD